jgi:hypothetical protein
MTDLPSPDIQAPPPPPAPVSSVVLDTNAKVSKSHLPLIIAGVLVVAFAAYSVVWFATRDAAYQPGPAATAVVQGLSNADLGVEFSGGELKCIDTTFAGADLTELAGAYDPFGVDLSEDLLDRTFTMFDDCLEQASRLDLLTASLKASDLGTDDQRRCAAEKYDALVLDNGGYHAVMVDYVDLGDKTLAVFTDCGIDILGGSDSTDSGSGDSGSGSPCEAERRTIETAIEAYYASNGFDATGYSDLVPDYLRDDPSDRWEFVPGVDGGYPTVLGLGECEGY